MTQFVLGSASAGRLRVLRQAGIDPLVVVSDVDEDALIASLDPETPPEAVVLKLANAKAVDVAAQLPDDVAVDCVVLGCDSMLYRDGKLWGKPGSASAAHAQWLAMAGSTAHLLTGHALLAISKGVIVHADGLTDSTNVRFGTPSESEIGAYVASGEPANVAGAFTIDGLGGWFVDWIEGNPSNVVGLSLPHVHRMLASAGISPVSFWKH
ncbi:Maf-like protein [Mycolicibacterium rufum]|uniref:Nucleoside triphosphate pyrophosphatase n=1 Tax=Mycolicibacterium rufum TaxID=318424 RepID=A0A9X2YGS9_9MYCO|nr:nucleoside triphosphate pyrophosphatase [Mycolicibacterium rufum]KGI67293.1 septum formation inhibitor Maf [Mycolicibacterium rufum]MCV7073488.1 septum formation inhibitor Maf [Mycolicibacterium rufum]ULP38204.1 Maf-like protein [Mycolicibacterium rufum]